MTRPERTQLIGREPSPMEPGRRAAEAAWRIEWPRLIAGLTRLVGDIDAAEDLAQDALVAALQQWPREGVPPNPGAWLMLTAKHRAIDRRRVTAPPLDGRANDAVCRLVANAIGVRRSCLTILRGERAPDTVIAIDGVDQAEVDAAIRAAMDVA
jgi:DNA-directed RNA polymerase specialized sigma24 family protein